MPEESEHKPFMVRCPGCLIEQRMGIEYSGDAHFVLNGVTITCGFCGKESAFPGWEVWHVVDEGLTITRSLDQPREAALRLVEALRKATTERDLDTIRAQPAFEAWKKWIPRSPKELKVHIAVLVAIAALLKNCHPQESKPGDVIFHVENGGTQIINLQQAPAAHK